MAIFSDRDLVCLADGLKAYHDRKVSVPVLRDIMKMVEDELFRQLAKPDGQIELGRIGKIIVQKLEIPDEPLPEDEPAEFYLCAIESNEMTRAIEDAADRSAVLPKAHGESKYGLDLGGMDTLVFREELKRKRRVARGEPLEGA